MSLINSRIILNNMVDFYFDFGVNILSIDVFKSFLIRLTEKQIESYLL